MTVIQQPDPLGGLNSLAEGYGEGRDRAMTLALAKAKQESDQRNETRSLDIQQKNSESAIASQKIHDTIDQATEETREHMAPLIEELTHAQITAAHDASQASQAQTAMDRVTKAAADFELYLKKKYGEQIAQTALKQAVESLKSVAASTAQTIQQTKDAALAAPGQRALTAAETNASNAGAAASMHAANAPYNTAGTAAAGYGSALEAYTHLSAQGRSIVDKVDSGQMTERAGALAAQRLGPQEAQKVISAITTLDADPTRHTTAADAQGAIEKMPGFGALPGNVQAAILRQTKQGINPRAAAQVVIDAKTPEGQPAVDEPTQAKIKQVFGIGTAGAPGAPPQPPAPPYVPPRTGEYGQKPPPAPAGNPLAPLTNLFSRAFHAPGQ